MAIKNNQANAIVQKGSFARKHTFYTYQWLLILKKEHMEDCITMQDSIEGDEMTPFLWTIKSKLLVHIPMVVNPQERAHGRQYINARFQESRWNDTIPLDHKIKITTTKSFSAPITRIGGASSAGTSTGSDALSSRRLKSGTLELLASSCWYLQARTI